MNRFFISSLILIGAIFIGGGALLPAKVWAEDKSSNRAQNSIADRAQSSIAEIPAFGDKSARQQRPEIIELKRLLFLTTIDFPPFNYVNDEKQLTGFHIDLARALCAELNFKEICQIQALPWQELEAALEEDKGDVIISGVGVTLETRAKYLFGDTYFEFPGRFLVKNGTHSNPSNSSSLASQLNVKGVKIASIKGSGHELYVKKYFPTAEHKSFKTQDLAIKALNENEVDVFFSDGLRLAKFLNEQNIACNCQLMEGSFFSKPYFGEGLAIALPKDKLQLKTALDWALSKLYEKGIMQELYLRYFPIGVF